MSTSDAKENELDHQVPLGRPPLKISKALTLLPADNTLPALSPFPFSGGN